MVTEGTDLDGAASRHRARRGRAALSRSADRSHAPGRRDRVRLRGLRSVRGRRGRRRGVRRDRARSGGGLTMGRFHRHDDGDRDHSSSGRPDAATTPRTGPDVERVEVLERIFDENDRCAGAEPRRPRRCRRVRDQPDVVSRRRQDHPARARRCARSPGRVRVGVIEGDIETSIDADRLAGLGAVDRADQHRQRLRRRVPPRRADGALSARPAAARPRSTWSSSRTSATWSARPSSTSASTPGR